MIEVTGDLKTLIEENIHLIENDEFERLYYYVSEAYPSVFIRKLSEVLLTCKINPLEHLLYVPKKFLMLSLEFTSIDIPDHIKEIGESAFSSTILERIVLPKNLEQLGHVCFAKSDIKVLDCFKCKNNLYFGPGTCLSCEKLECIYLPNKIQITFEERSFQNTPKLKEIIYNGRLEEFYINCVFKEGWRYSSHNDNVLVRCTDGDRYINKF